MSWEIRDGDCREVMASMAASSVDAIVTDPPYGLSFMGKGWDHGIPGVEFWTEALRVAKPGAHLLAFGGTRTYHRLACAIEDAGWEIRDCLSWLYGSGFPKSLDVSKAIDKAAGAERERMVNPRWVAKYPNGPGGNKTGGDRAATVNQLKSISGNPLEMTLPATDLARLWHGWGTALKPAWEPVIVARKPLAGTVAANVLEHGTGAINVDGCRVGTEDMSAQFDREWKQDGTFGNGKRASQGKKCPPGRWPANLIHDGSEEATAPMGEAARYFYCAKASKADRDEGCEGMEEQPSYMVENGGKTASPKADGKRRQRTTTHRNNHPTVKPTALMRYLCRLVTPPGGTVLDPFCGSGSTGKAAVREGFGFIGIEREAEYAEIARCRIQAALEGQEPDLFG
jgi:DNA modification methylase